MANVINVKELRSRLRHIVERVRRGDRFTVLYRSRPAFEIVPPGQSAVDAVALSDDPLYRAKPLGRSKTGDIAARHDEILYGK